MSGVKIIEPEEMVCVEEVQQIRSQQPKHQLQHHIVLHQTKVLALCTI